MSTARRKFYPPGPLNADHLPGLAGIVVDLRPSWDAADVLAILTAHRTQVDGATLVRVAVDCATDPDLYDPRAIGWSLRRSTHAPLPRCDTCGKPADECARRPGRDDDHAFVEAVRRA